MFQPIIKWSGSKRSQSDEIIKYFPKEIETYYEPFIGGGSILRALLDNKDIKCKNFIASDLNNDLISLWKLIKSSPEEIYNHYNQLWNELNETDDIGIKRSYFESVRERFNKEKDPKDFMFIMRTTTNGMPRYNSLGEFNNSFHLSRSGIKPETFKSILFEWSDSLNKNNVTFISQSYEKINPNSNDFVYLDPPYANTKNKMYYGSIDNEKLFDFIKKLPCSWLMSFDGISGEENNTYAVPDDIFDSHVYIKSGNSSFKRVTGKSKDSVVYESLYIKNKHMTTINPTIK